MSFLCVDYLGKKAARNVNPGNKKSKSGTQEISRSKTNCAKREKINRNAKKLRPNLNGSRMRQFCAIRAEINFQGFLGCVQNPHAIGA
jgi:hypothetical protein